MRHRRGRRGCLGWGMPRSEALARSDRPTRGGDATRRRGAHMPKAILAEQPGGPEVLRLWDVERPAPGPGELLIKVTGIGINFIDTYQRSGVYTVPFPFTPGGEAAGQIGRAHV